ncbi:hypothetical protein BDR26DRAFT_879243, partial [Obelidium mucronatum]
MTFLHSTTQSRETQPLVGAFPSAGHAGYNTIVDEQCGDNMLSFLPPPLQSVSVDEQILAELKASNTKTTQLLLALHVALVVPPVLILLSVRSKWDDIPRVLFPGSAFLGWVSKDGLRALALITPWISLALSSLSLSYFGVRLLPATSQPQIIGAFPASSSEYSVSQSPLIPRGLPLSPWLLDEIAKAAKGATVPTPLDAAIDALVWWAEHPASVAQRSFHLAHSSMISFLVAQTLFTLFTSFAFHHEAGSSSAFLTCLFLGAAFASPLVYIGAKSAFDRDLRTRPVEYRGIGEGGLIAGIDLKEVVLHAMDKGHVSRVSAVFGM